MQPLAETAGWLFGWLLRNSAHAAILAVVVWILERTVCRNLAPRWRYGLWLLVLARLLLPVGPESRLSLFNLVDLAPATVAGPALQVLRLPPPVVPAVEPPDPLADTPWWFISALALWFSGALTLAGLVGRDHRRLRQALSATSPVLDETVLDLLRQSKAVMAVRRCVDIVETPEITSPAISGWRRPRLLLPTGLLLRLTPDEIRFLFLHELAHVKRADLPFNWIIAVIQVLHWFNPVVWLALRRLLAVREEVCDDLVLRRCFPGAARDYGLTLLRLLEECAPRRLVPSLAGALGDIGALRQRILCIRNFRLRDPHPSIPAALTVAVAIAGLTERIGEPLFLRSTGGSGAETQAAEEYPARVRAPAGRRPIQLAAAEEGAERRNAPAASRVVETLTTVVQQAIQETRAFAASDGGAGDKHSMAASPASALSEPPAATGARTAAVRPVQKAATPVTTPAPSMRTLARPYPLPPVNERGNILNPPRSASITGSAPMATDPMRGA